MKLSTKILLAMLVASVASLVISNLLLKLEYDKVDKTDLYWTYDKVLQQPFSHLRIKGGNTTRIAFEQSKNCSVRLSHEWVRYHGGRLNPVVKNDTLIIDFDYVTGNTFEKFWLQNLTAVRIFCPELRSINGVNTNLRMSKMKQKNFTVDLSGKSFFKVESMMRDLDSLKISARDSSDLVFKMSPEYKQDMMQDKGSAFSVETHVIEIKNKEAMSLKSVVATIQGTSLLDIGHAQINAIKLDVSDSSGIILSGSALKKLRQ